MRQVLTDVKVTVIHLKRFGFLKTLRKVTWALETRGFHLKVKRNKETNSGVFDYPNWTDKDLLSRAFNIRTHPPRSEVRNFAFYLPQFHEIKENDHWWGKGFTEWTNVRKSTALFDGHYQPHEPLNDNYYDLSEIAAMEEQAKLAKLFGIDAFVMYYYWFNGKKLLEKPFENLMENPEVAFPFMICWANESWTRRWDGKQGEILIEQKYQDNFAREFIIDVSRHFDNPNYQTINGRPILLVYRPEEIPNIVRVTSEWRSYVKDLGYTDLYLIAVQSFAKINADNFGFDASSNFAPNNMGLVPAQQNLFEGNLFEFNDLIRYDQIKTSSYPVFSCVTPSWDNTARRGSKGTVVLGGSPDKFRDWLYRESNNAKKAFSCPDERIVFINAWNEWAEGSHLEPDKKFGYQWLHSVADCKEEIYWGNFSAEKLARELIENQEYIFEDPELENQKSCKLILVIHDLHRNGAQINGMNMLKEFLGKGINVQVIALTGGPLFDDFKDLFKNNLIIVNGLSPQEFGLKIESLKSNGYNCAIINSVASGQIADLLSQHGIDIVSLVHEFPETIKDYQLVEAATKVASYSKFVVFPSEYVHDQFSRMVKVKNKVKILPQGLYNLESQRIWPEWQATKLIQELDWGKGSPIVIGVGFGDLRKGIDLFCKAAEELDHLNFLWVGDVNTGQLEIEDALRRPPKNLRIVKFQNEISKYLQIADLLLITSRKDPYPSTVLEALGRGMPVIVFKDCTGLEDLMGELKLPVVEPANPSVLSEAIDVTLSDESIEKKEFRSGFIREHMNFRNYCSKLLSLHSLNQKTVATIVPSYNYENFLLARLNQIESQNYTVDQIIFFDDASTDASFVKGRDFLHLSKSQVFIEKNAINSGSPFSNWSKLIAKSDSDYTWIAETDDIASIDFLNSLVSQEVEIAGLSYCNSAQVDNDGQIISSDFSQYLKRISRRDYRKSYYFDGEKEIIDCLSIQNTIPNISAVLFQTAHLKKHIESIQKTSLNLKTAMDWYLYIKILEETSVYYSCLTLNAQRRHNTSVIATSSKELMLSEILQIQKYVASRYKLPLDVIDASNDFIQSIKTK
jgi:glycosyltransferase involved in cell wall biosynthesis